MDLASIAISAGMLLAVVAGFARVLSHAHSMFHPKDSKTSAAIGNALQELDRLVARPSVEHKVEAEDHVQATDEHSGK